MKLIAKKRGWQKESQVGTHANPSIRIQTGARIETTSSRNTRPRFGDQAVGGREPGERALGDLYPKFCLKFLQP
jgi:hypothetical protein